MYFKEKYNLFQIAVFSRFGIIWGNNEGEGKRIVYRKDESPVNISAERQETKSILEGWLCAHRGLFITV